jgi:hypothetical protein
VKIADARVIVSSPGRNYVTLVIEAEDGAVIMVEWHGYGRAYPPGRRRSSGRCSTWPTNHQLTPRQATSASPMTARTANPCPVSANLVRGAAWQPPVGRPRWLVSRSP